MSTTTPTQTTARAALAKALKRAHGIQLDVSDEGAGLVMHELRKLGFRVLRMSESQRKAYAMFREENP